jgi:acyl dehydratase
VASTLYLEEFTTGQRFVSPEFVLSEGDLLAFGAVSGDEHPMHTPGARPADEVVGHGPLGIARYFGTVFADGILADSVLAALDARWRFRAPLRIGARLHYETLVTGWRRSTSRPDRGILHRHVTLLDDSGTVVQEGATAVLVRARGEDAAHDPAGALPLSRPWARAVVARLEDDPAFRDPLQLFDGTIGLESDVAGVQLRVYKGRVIDVATRVPRCATFTLRGDAEHWTALLTGERNDLIVRARAGEFSVAGDAYAYLQLTHPLHLIVDAGRAIAAEEKTR